MLKILLSGCNGRMGTAVSQLCRESDTAEIVAGVDTLCEKRFDYPVYADFLEFSGAADVIIDFSNSSVCEALLSYSLRRKLPAVIATTGFSQEQQTKIADVSREIPIFLSGNMSVGISLLAELVRKTAAFLGDEFNIEIIEKHHNNKVDAPSGTALMLFEAAKEALPYPPEPVYDRHGVRQKRGKTEIGIHAVRGGTIVGEHSVIFAGHNEVIELSHSAQSREVLASGAVRAARFLAVQEYPRKYTMSDLIGQIK